MPLLDMYILHTLVYLTLGALALTLIVRMILSWLPFLGPSNPVVRFVNDLTDPLLNPIRKRIPSTSAGFMDISTTVALVFVFWALFMLSAFIQLALPAKW